MDALLKNCHLMVGTSSGTQGPFVGARESKNGGNRKRQEQS